MGAVTTAAAQSAEGLDGTRVGDVVKTLASVRPASTGSGMIGQLRELEDLKSAAAALQARIAVAFDPAQRREQAAAGVPAGELGAGISAQVALARRESPARGGRLLGLAKALATEMPRTLAALQSGQLNEWRATLIVKETACLSAEDRCAVDEELAADAGTFAGAGDRAITAAVRAAAYRRDPHSVAKRASHAVSERTVTLHPAPDMAHGATQNPHRPHLPLHRTPTTRPNTRYSCPGLVLRPVPAGKRSGRIWNPKEARRPGTRPRCAAPAPGRSRCSAVVLQPQP